MKTSKILVFLITLICIFNFVGCAQRPSDDKPKVEISFIKINPDIKLRRMIVDNPEEKGTILFLHGFPETIYSWKEISLMLGKNYDVHAFDWPGYGLSTRPSADKFSYSPKDYASILKDYIKKSGINSSKLLVYSTDIGSLPALLLALEEPTIMKKIIVGDFAPFDQPQYMYSSLQSLKVKSSAEKTRTFMNKNRDDILANTYRRGFSKEEQFDISKELEADMRKGWEQSNITSADAFYHYYSNFSRDQNYFESHLKELKTPVVIIWGEKDIYIKKEMGMELAKKLNIELKVLPGIGHHPHLQNPELTVKEVNSSF